MVGSITHTFVSAVPDDPTAAAAGEVLPQAHWNAGHTFNLTTADIPDDVDKRYVKDTDLTNLFNLSGDNSGDQLVFKTIAVAGQSNVVADTTSDTLTLVAGTNVTITTNASTDTITINASGGGGSGTVTSVSAGTGIDTGGSPITTSGTVSLAATASNTILSNVTAGSAVPSANTGAAVTAILSPFVASGASHAKGLVPDPGATALPNAYLGADATFKNAPSIGVYTTNNWISNPTISAGTFTAAANTIYFSSIPIYANSVSIKNLAARITTLAAGNMQLALYTVSNSGRPDVLIGSTGSTSTGATGSMSVAITGGPVTVSCPGVYIALNCDATPTFSGNGTTSWAGSSPFGDGALGNLLGNSARVGYTLAQTFGTWPSGSLSVSDRVTSIACMNMQVN